MSAEAVSRLNADAAAEPGQLFVINLCASTSPMALSHPNTPELKRYTFFVSRQREEGRERFRLHMGYFNSQEDAEALLSAVRDVYPAAWAGPAPTSGVPRRARVAAVAAPALVAAPAAPIGATQPAAIAQAPAPAAVVTPPVAKSSAPVAQPVAAPTPALETMSNVRDVLAKLSEEAPAKASASSPKNADAPRREPVKPTAVKPEAPKAQAARPARVQTPELDASQTLHVLESAAPRTVQAAVAVQLSSAARVPAAAASAPAQGRHVPSVVQDDSEVRVVTPEDTQTLSDIRLDAENNAPPCFAVQLVWAVAPIDAAALPHLAIFDAYSLYNVEGSRQGRKWYGLRLGFFSDPNSATQVAHYVRSDYPTVAVVPVAIKERDHAKGGSVAGATARLGDAAAPLKPESEVSLEKQGLDGFELLKDDRPRPEKRDFDDIGAVRAKPVATATARPAVQAANKALPVTAAAKLAVNPAGAPRATGRPTGKRVVVRPRPPQKPARAAAPGAPNPLESTLDILGASTLTLDESREIVNDSAIRKPIEKKSGSRFSKLLSRLSGS